jgi:hypothetical protein
MFVQVIQGKTSDAEGLRRQFDRWQQEIGRGATGFLGSTGGVAADGAVVLIARFESPDAARTNSDRPEQGAWWAETAKYFDGEPTFRDYTDVDLTLGGGSDKAGFVQVMRGRSTDRARLGEIEAKFMSQMTAMRPDVLGSLRVWDGQEFTEAIYFTSEAEARKGEAAMGEAGAEGGAEFAEYGTLVQDVTYLDLTDPWFASA